MTDYQKEILFTTSIQLNSSECSRCKNIDGLIKYKLKKEHENLCNKHGYVLENTLKLINRSIGKIVTHDNMSMIEYNITMKINENCSTGVSNIDVMTDGIVNGVSRDENVSIKIWNGILNYINSSIINVNSSTFTISFTISYLIFFYK